MVKVVLASVSIVLGAAACSSTAARQPLPPVWSASYAVPFDAMVGCLAAKPAGAFAVSAPDHPAGRRGGHRLHAGKHAAGGLDLYRPSMAGSGSQVIWRRPGNVGGLDWLDGEARTRADRCGNS